MQLIYSVEYRPTSITFMSKHYHMVDFWQWALLINPVIHRTPFPGVLNAYTNAPSV